MKWVGIVVAVVIAAVAIYSMAYPSLTLRYRLTLEAEVDSEPKIGEGVVEVTYGKQLNIRSELTIGVRGEAAVLDLGKRGTLFALLKEGTDGRSNPESIVFRAFGFDGGAFPGPTVEEGLKKIGRLSGKRELPLTSLPLLVRFRDTSDPTSVEPVDPLDISKAFGVGTSLVRATIEIVPAGIWPLNSFGITGEPISTGIEERLRWLGTLKGGYLDGAFAGGGTALSNVLFGGNFKTGS